MEDNFDEEDIEERRERVKEGKKNKKEKIIMIPNEEHKLLEKIRGNPWMLASFVLGALVLILLITNFGGITGNVTKNAAGENLVKFLNTNAPSEITLKDTSSESGLYKVNVEYQGQIIPLYVTKDGKYFIQGVTPITTDTSSTTSTTKDIPKRDKPKVDLYVMSFCPYGNRAENTMVPVYNLLKDKVEWNIYYIVSVNGNSVQSLHGQLEVDENEREACVLKDYGLGALWKFIIYVNNNCGSDGSCWKVAATQANVDSNKLLTCVKNNGLSLMKDNEAAANAAGASGSPTLIINGVNSDSVYKYGNADVYKEAICSAFSTAPSECSTQLQNVADSGATGSCG